LLKCKHCGLPATKPNVKFVDGICSACLNYFEREQIDWKERQKSLERLLDQHHRTDGNYDVVIPVSGGKDSHWLVKKMQEFDMHPLLVTVNDSFTHTQAGLANLRNLQTMYDSYVYTINHNTFIKATRHAFEQLGYSLKLVEYAIYTIPYLVAWTMKIPLVVFGENALYEYGGTDFEQPQANSQINGMIDQMEHEYAWWMMGDVSIEEINHIKPTVYYLPMAIYMSYFYPWSSVEHLKVAKTMGFKTLSDTGEWDREGCMEDFEQIDSYGYIAHLWLRYPRLGFQRTTDIATRRVREGLLSYDEAQKIIAEKDHRLDSKALKDFCEVLGYTEDEFMSIVTNASWNKYYKEK